MEGSSAEESRASEDAYYGELEAESLDVMKAPMGKSLIKPRMGQSLKSKADNDGWLPSFSAFYIGIEETEEKRNDDDLNSSNRSTKSSPNQDRESPPTPVSTNESIFGRTVQIFAFPEKHVHFATSSEAGAQKEPSGNDSNSHEQSTISVQFGDELPSPSPPQPSQEESTFEKTMDNISNPGKQINCASSEAKEEPNEKPCPNQTRSDSYKKENGAPSDSKDSMSNVRKINPSNDTQTLQVEKTAIEAVFRPQQLLQIEPEVANQSPSARESKKKRRKKWFSRRKKPIITANEHVFVKDDDTTTVFVSEPPPPARRSKLLRSKKKEAPAANNDSKPIGYHRGGARQPKSVEAKKSEDEGVFAKTMDVIAFPERHVNGAAPGFHAQRNFEKTMDIIAFPEKHLNAGLESTIHPYGYSPTYLNGFGSVRGCAAPKGGRITKEDTYGYEPDMLDYVFDGAESVACSYISEMTDDDQRSTKSPEKKTADDQSIMQANSILTSPSLDVLTCAEAIPGPHRVVLDDEIPMPMPMPPDRGVCDDRTSRSLEMLTCAEAIPGRDKALLDDEMEIPKLSRDNSLMIDSDTSEMGEPKEKAPRPVPKISATLVQGRRGRSRRKQSKGIKRISGLLLFGGKDSTAAI